MTICSLTDCDQETSGSTLARWTAGQLLHVPVCDQCVREITTGTRELLERFTEILDVGEITLTGDGPIRTATSPVIPILADADLHDAHLDEIVPDDDDSMVAGYFLYGHGDA